MTTHTFHPEERNEKMISTRTDDRGSRRPDAARPRAAGSVVSRALSRVAHPMKRRSPEVDRSVTRTRTLNRVLLIVPPSDSSAPGVPLPVGLAATAASLRAAGFVAEIYDATASHGERSIKLHIEHSYPQVVVVAAQNRGAEIARQVLRAAREVVPGVLTVILGEPQAGAASRDSVVDMTVADGAGALPRLLARLNAGEQTWQIAEPAAA